MSLKRLLMMDQPTVGGGGFNDPTDLANLKMWWDASDAASFSLSGSSVTQWNDKSGNARHLVPRSAQPARTGSKNGLTTVVFTNDPIRVAATNMITGTTMTLLMVVLNDAGPWGRVISMGPTGGANDYGTSGAVAINTEISGGWPNGYSNGSQLAVPGSDYKTVWIAMAYIFGGGNVSLYVNGNLEDTTTWSGSPWDIDQLEMGGSFNNGDYNSDMEMAECVIYSDVKSGSDLTDVTDYLMTKWGI